MNSITSVLIVDDEPAVRDLMARWVTSLGLKVKTAANVDEALATLRRHPYDLAVIDVMMPGQNGLWLANEVHREHPNTAVVIATAYTELLGKDGEARAIADLLVKPFQLERFALAMDRGRVWRKQAIAELEWHAWLSAELNDRTQQICAELAHRSARDGDEAGALVALARERTPEVAAHGERVARFAQSVARELGREAELGGVLDDAARFHDVGKLAIPDALLTKPSPLTDGEVAIMRKHVQIGAQILASTRTLRALAPLVLASHEWFGGTGYPFSLAGGDIPVHSRIIAVADAYDAMTQDRSYRAGMDSSEAIQELLRCRDAQFDPQILGAFLAVLSRH
jgi:putative two-component system response regulator